MVTVSVSHVYVDGDSKLESPAASKQPRYQLGREQRGAIKADASNKKMWDDLLSTTKAVSHLTSHSLTSPISFSPSFPPPCH